MSSRILLLSADFGSGHLGAANAIAQACREQDPGVTVRAVNVEGRLLSLISSGYLTLLSRQPSLYRRLYQAPVTRGMRQLIRTAFLPAVRHEILHFRPTAVVVTHPFPAAAAAYLRQTGQLAAPLTVMLTDFTPHPIWVHPGVDRYCVASWVAGQRLQRLGVAPDAVKATGIPIHSDFALVAGKQPPVKESRVRRVLVMGGGLGLGPITEAVRALSLIRNPNLSVAVVCGKNEAVRRDLADLFCDDPRIKVLGYTHLIPQLMARADLLITKPGGLSCSEALASNLPMLLLHPLPGHEEENAAYLVGTGAARIVDETWVGNIAQSLLFTLPERLLRMQEFARRAGRPLAAAAVANEIFTKSQSNDYQSATA